jgi:hypothetical protein
MKHIPNHTWNIVLVVLTLILITLVTLHLRQWRRATDVATPATIAEENAVPTPTVEMPAEAANLIRVTTANVAVIENRNLAQRPADVPGALETPVEIKQALQRQTRDLLAESLTQPEAEEDRRALALSKEEILQLEKEGRMAY